MPNSISLESKKYATAEDLAMYRAISQGRYVMQLGDAVIQLDSLDEYDFLDASEKAEADADNPYWDEEKNRPECQDLPASVDHRAGQTPIRNQLHRGTCVCFASLACLEAMLLASKQQEFDLSEQYTNWLFMRFQGKTQCDDGMKTTFAAKYLSQAGVCQESLAPYEDRDVVRDHCGAGPSAAAQGDARYGIGNYTLIDNLGLQGPSIANTDYLECLLSSGHDVVFGTYVAWGKNPDENGVYDVILDRYGNPLAERGGHAILLVGYDRSGAIPYFIFKNSWGTAAGVQGYYYLSYDYVRQYAKYGYIVHEIRADFV
jgi:C1A family cysteine protease